MLNTLEDREDVNDKVFPNTSSLKSCLSTSYCPSLVPESNLWVTKEELVDALLTEILP